MPYGSLSAYMSAYQTTGYWEPYKAYMKEAPAPVSPAPSTDPVTVQKPTTIDENGNTITGSITTYPDGSVVDTTIVTKPNGDTTTTVVEKGPPGKPPQKLRKQKWKTSRRRHKDRNGNQ